MRNTIYFATLFCFFLVSCELDLPEEAYQPTEPATSRDIDVPMDFDFKMINQIKLTIKVPDSSGVARVGIPLYVYTANPAEGGSLLENGITDAQGEFKTVIEVASSLKTLAVFTTHPYIAYSQEIEITDGEIYMFWGSAPPVGATNQFDYVFSSLSEDMPETFECVAELLLNQGFEQPTDFSVAPQIWGSAPIQAAAFDEGDIPGWLTTAPDGRIELWKSGFNGVQSYEGNQHAEINANQEASLYQDVPTVPGQVLLWKFAHRGRGGDDVISLFIGEPGNESLVTTETTGTAQWEEYYGIYTVPVDQTTTRFRWEAVSTGSGNRSVGNFLDAISFGIACDSDDDGILDIYDEDPNDPDVSVNPTAYVPSQASAGTYAFEDFWPKKGDFDYNDLVLGYNYTYYKDENGRIKFVDCNYEVKGVGASKKIGFGLSYENLTSNQIDRVEGTFTSSINTLSNGCEAGQNKAVVIMFEDAHSLLGVPTGRITNTDISIPSVPTYSFTVRVYFTNPMEEELVEILNPFIFTGGDRGHEIHFMNQPPTSLADTNLFGDEADRTQPNLGRYYVDSDGFPWGMNFPTSFNYPKERVDVVKAYPIFASWASSGGTAHTDWYEPQHSDVTKVYE